MKRDTRRMQWRRWKVTKWETTEKKSSNRKATHYICASESHIELPRYTYSSYGTEALYNESREKIHAHNGSSSRSSTHTLSLASHNGRRHFILFSLFFTRFAHLTISTNSIRAIGLRYIAFFATNWYACYCTFHTVGTDGKRARRRRRRRRQVWRRGILYTNIREREQMRCFSFEFFFCRSFGIVSHSYLGDRFGMLSTQSIYSFRSFHLRKKMHFLEFRFVFAVANNCEEKN